MKIKQTDKKDFTETKSLKGFTLIEVVMAILIFAIGSALLVSAGVAIINNIKESRNIVRKINYETGIVSYAPVINSSNPIDAYNGLIDVYSGLTEIKLSSSSIVIPSGYDVIKVEAYEAQPYVEKDAEGNVMTRYATKSSYNLKYFRPVL